MDSDVNTPTRRMGLGDLNVDYNDELAEQLNDEFRKAVMPVTCFIGTEAVAGFFGNLLVMYVFLFHYHVCNFRYFVLCMAFIDFISTLTTMPGEILTQLYWYIYPHRIVCKIKSFFNVFTVTAEALCLLTIALDRYRKICTPFGWQIQPKFAIVLCGVIYALAFILALPVAFFWGIHHSEEQYQNHTVFTTECETDEQFNGTSHPLKYSIAVECIISICLSLMIILYLFVARKLVTGKHNIVVKSKIKVKANFPLSQPGASSEVFDKNEYELSSRQENSGAECSSGVESKRKKAEFNYISSDGGLTTDEEEDSTGRTVKLTLPTGNTESPVRTQTEPQKLTSKRKVWLRVRRKTKIVVILTVLFIFTTILYLTLLSFIAKNILLNMSAGEKTVYFFFFRLYFINHVLKPVLYGFLDPHFKKVILQLKHNIFVCTPHNLRENK